jgi:dTDP-4-amino-4,6-dideoxygalactose transaminase
MNMSIVQDLLSPVHPEGAQELILLSKPFLPPLNEFTSLLNTIWKSHHITNRGVLHNRLEKELATFLKVEHLTLVTNGTLALMAAINGVGIEGPGEVITTPYTFVATAQAILACGLTPVFADIDPETLNLDPRLVEDLITPRTKAILPVHCYGRPCDVNEFERLSHQYGLPVIYDAAHAFDVQLGERNLLSYGDASILSLHATKVFHTIEGGLVVSSNARVRRRIERWRDFGLECESVVRQPGMNAKMSEVSAAMGLANLPYHQANHNRRREIAAFYYAGLCDIPGIEVSDPETNFGYFPIRVGQHYALSRDQLYDQLWQEGICVRRYFYPLITDFELFNGAVCGNDLPHAKKIASEVLCLPIHPQLTNADIQRVLDVLLSFSTHLKGEYLNVL